jgi:hypothetical protein
MMATAAEPAIVMATAAEPAIVMMVVFVFVVLMVPWLIKLTLLERPSPQNQGKRGRGRYMP